MSKIIAHDPEGAEGQPTKPRSDDGSCVDGMADLVRWLKSESHVMPRAKRVAFARFIDGLNPPQGKLPLPLRGFVASCETSCDCEG